jgi:hypothetical protein
MKNLFWTISLSALLLLSCQQLHSQINVSGTVIGSSTGEPLPAVNIRVPGTSAGTTTDNLGQYRLILAPGSHTLVFTCIGYLQDSIRFETGPEPGDSDVKLDTLRMKVASIGLSEISIIASEAMDRRTPVSVSSIRSEAIEQRLGDQPLPIIMNTVPGVYATRLGGGSGDASINIRGFKQENVALLLNGIPISSVENGLVYWNNWLGLTEATQQIQVQRGLGASQVALNSIGGTVNIITKTTNVEPGGSLKFSLTDYGNMKTTLSLSSGRLKNNMAVTFLGSRFTGPGYVDATYVDGWAYFLSVSKEFNSRHMLVFTALGNPERHGQRNFKLTQDETDEHGLRYNKDWGSYNGEINNASENFYHKPHFSLNHYWNVDEKSFLATSVYLSFGTGGGKWTDSFGNNPWIFSYYNPSGQIDWNAIYALNDTNTQVYTLSNGTDTSGYSVNIQTNFLASHAWGGILSTYKRDIGAHFRLTAGIHARLFRSSLQQKVRDLLGGDFYIDNYAYAADGQGGRDEIKHVGDIVKVDNGAINDYAGIFGQMEYISWNFSAFVAGTISGNWYRRVDNYNYLTDPYSEWVFKTGFDLKAGANLNLDEYNNIYVNGGYYSRAPYFKFVFGSFTNIPTVNLENEKTWAAEAGYGLNLRKTRFRLNGYYTLWKDKSVLTNEYNQFENPSMIQGLDALHFGVEAELRQNFWTWLMVGGSFSLGDWKWQNDVTALLFNDDNVVIDTINVYASGLYVGDAPQTQLSLFGSVMILRTVSISAYYNYYDRLYADFSPTTRTNPEDDEQPFRLPAYHNLDIYANCPFKIGKLDAQIDVGCQNVLNTNYIIRGEDGPSHSSEDFKGFWGFGRTFYFSLGIKF